MANKQDNNEGIYKNGMLENYILMDAYQELASQAYEKSITIVLLLLIQEKKLCLKKFFKEILA